MKYETSINDSSNNKRIAKNTLLLYFRMLLMMVVTLYTSRVVLATLGVEDYGIYNVVGGVVTMFGFISGCMSTATQRYLTFELGKGRVKRLQEVFNVSILIHGIVALVILVVAETIGLWFLWNKMQIPTGRLDAAFWVYQSSVLAALIMIMSIPYNATIIAHERMSAFACISVLEVLLKLGIVYLLLLLNVDKLILYAVLIVAVQFAVRICYGWYCKCHFKETRIRLTWNRCLIKEMLSFAGWSIVGNAAYVAYTQGINVLLNIFFGPTVNAARAISVQIQHAVNMFSQNFQTAINPQITKSYAASDYVEMYTLIYRSSKFTFFLLLFLSLPVMIETEYMLNLWLTVVPDDTVIFTRLILCTTIIDSMANPLMVAVTATGHIRRYHIIVGGCLLSIIPLSYGVLKLGYSPASVLVVHFLLSVVAFAIRLCIVTRMINMPLYIYIKEVILKSLKVVVLSVPVPLVISFYLHTSFIVTGVVCVVSVSVISYVFGLDENERTFVGKRLKGALLKMGC